MKGGAASGVVYPGAVLELSKRYRFANVGGTSAGAVAAALAAAAEFGRQRSGRLELGGVEEIIEQLAQPQGVELDRAIDALQRAEPGPKRQLPETPDPEPDRDHDHDHRAQPDRNAQPPALAAPAQPPEHRRGASRFERLATRIESARSGRIGGHQV